jgi:urease accessory protein
MILRAVSLALVLTVSISPANAHDAIAGGGPFVNGILHPAIEPAHLLSLLALGLWIGRQERAALRRSTVTFAVALIAGLFAGPLGTLPPLVPIACALILGCLAGGGWPWPSRAAAIASAATAIVIGFDSGADDWALALGIWVGAMLILLNVVNLVMRIEAAWLRIGVRIAGAWIAAIALMLLALSLRA